MLSEQAEYGGSITVTSAYTIRVNTPRVIVVSSNAPSVTTPNPTAVEFYQRGGFRYLVLNTNSSNVVALLSHTGSTLATIPTGSAAELSLAGTKWVITVRPYTGTLRTYNKGTRSAVTVISQSSANPYCVDGDVCLLAEDAGLGPLNGTNGKPMVVAPMYFDPSTMNNSVREPIRSADYVMPSIIGLRFKRGEFQPDPLHPLASNVLSSGFYEALYSDDKTLLLTYQGKVSSVSRHWYHLRWSTLGGWNHSVPTCSRHTWQVVRSYTDASGALRNLEIVFVMEHTLTVDPVAVPGTASSASTTYSQSTAGIADSSGRMKSWGFKPGQLVQISGFTGGGYNGLAVIKTVEPSLMTFESGIALAADAAGELVTIAVQQGSGQGLTPTGAWGALFHVLVFTDELPSGAYTPVGSSTAQTFTTRNDPCWWGRATGVAGSNTDDDRFCHPQLVLAGTLPTTFHAPIGKLFVPIEERRRVAGELMGNREWCYEVGNGAPWTTTNTSPQNALNLGIHKNIVFGVVDSPRFAAGMTLGGDAPTSVIPSFVCWENGKREGRTYLYPNKPGWSETEGTLSITGGSGVELTFCTGTQANGNPWPDARIDPCIGNPQDLLGGIGGTHRVFKTGANPSGPGHTMCCVNMPQATSLVAEQVCLQTTTRQGPANPFTLQCDNCTEPPVCCKQRVQGRFTTLVPLGLEDYDNCITCGSIVRVATWKGFKNLIDRSFRAKDYTYSPTNTLTAVAQLNGTWNQSTTISATSSGVSWLLDVATNVNTSSPQYWVDTDHSVSFQCVSGREHGVVLRTTGSTQQTGLTASIRMTGTTTAVAEIATWVSGTRTVIASRNIPTVVASGTMNMLCGVWGTEVYLSWTGAATGSLEANTCYTSTTGRVGLLGSNNATFTSWQYTDRTLYKGSATGVLNSVQALAAVDSGVLRGKCNKTGPDPGECGYPTCCSYNQYALYPIDSENDGLSTATTVGVDIELGACANATSTVQPSNPTSCGNSIIRCECENQICAGRPLPCEASEDRCGACPTPYSPIKWCIGSRGYEKSLFNDIEEAQLCKGVQRWDYCALFCSE